MKKFCTWILLSCMLAGSLTAVATGCGAPAPVAAGKESGGITVVFVPKLTGNAFFEAANEGAQAFAKAHGFNVEYVGAAEASVEKQIAIVEDAIASHASAICISSLDATALDDVLKRAMGAGIAVTTWDSDVSGDARSLMVSQGTPDQLGEMLVEMGAKSLEEQGRQITSETIKYAWHYSQASVTDQNSWRVSGEAYIQSTYPNWENLNPDNYYSEQDPGRAHEVGKAIFAEHPDIDLIICNDSTALPGQAQAAMDMGLSAEDVTITGFASPNAVREYCKAGVVRRWGLWDCQVQGALGCYLACYLASGNRVMVGDKLNIPDVGIVEVMPNSVLDPAAYTAKDSGVVLLPKRTEFTIDNVDDYQF